MIDQFAAAVREATEQRRALCIRGGGTKDFYGRETRGDILSTSGYRGLVDYEPNELTVTARCGTPLAEIEAALRAQGQMLAFEPPYFGSAATLGGCIAAGLSGPRRPYAGAVRDFVLGVRVLDGKGNDLRFGGTVMKNVAGYDISRLMAGSLGTLGIILETSLKVLPIPVGETTLCREHSQAEALAAMNEWAGKPLPISATCHVGKLLYVRLSGAAAAVRAAREKIGGEAVPEGAAFWRSVREQEHEWFDHPHPLWRLSVKPTTPPLNVSGQQLIEWGGALRWLKSDADHETTREAARFGGGHATLFRGGKRSVGVFQPLPAALDRIHRRVKQALDPNGVFNPGRIYEGM